MTPTPRAKRHTLYFLNVFDGRTGESLGQLVDISQDGVSILSETPLKPASTYLLRILVPQNGKPDQRLEFEGESRWTSPDPDSGFHTTGFHITFLTDEQRGLIERLVSEFGYSRIGEVKLTAPREVKTGPRGEPPNPLRRFLQTLFTR